MPITQIVLTGILICLLSALFVSGILSWTKRQQILDIPNERSSHTQPTPLGGGLGIVVVTLGGLFVVQMINPVWTWFGLGAYIAGAALIAGISWIDDLHSLPSRTRFAAHSLGALLAIAGFGFWTGLSLPFSEQIAIGWLGLPITFLWIAGLINAYNFMDGIDGIAGSQAVVAGLGWAIIGWVSGQASLAYLGLFVAAASLGFLWHNWSPARIFMGDVGSAFLGYTFAVLPLIAAAVHSRLILAGVLVLWPFLFDTIFTIICRLRRGENIFAAHRSHLYQRLVIVGLSHRFVTLLYIGLEAFGLLLALLWVENLPGVGWLLVACLPLLSAGLWGFVVYRERKRAATLYAAATDAPRRGMDGMKDLYR